MCKNFLVEKIAAREETCILNLTFLRTLDLDLVVRDADGNILDPDETGVIELFRRVSAHLDTCTFVIIGRVKVLVADM